MSFSEWSTLYHSVLCTNNNNIYFLKCTSRITYVLVTFTAYNRCPLKHGHHQPMACTRHLLVNLFKVDHFTILENYLLLTYQLPTSYYCNTDVQHYYEINHYKDTFSIFIITMIRSILVRIISIIGGESSLRSFTRSERRIQPKVKQ